MELIDEIKIVNGVGKISITISNGGKVTLKHSKDVNKRAIESFVNSKAEWIRKHKDDKLKSIMLNKDLVEYKSIKIYGNDYKIEKSKRNNIINKTIHYTSMKNLRNLISEIANAKLLEKIDKYQKMINVKTADVMWDNSKTRWGVCTSKKVVKINIRSVMLPEYLFDYIIIHELCHLIHFNHSQKFWQEVEKYCPEFKQYKQDIKTYSFLFELYR